MEEIEPTTTDVAIIDDEGAFDPSNPRSLFNLLSKSYQDDLVRVKNSFLGESTEWIKTREIKNLKEFPVVRKLRQAMWIEYDNALKSDRKIVMLNVWPGLCSTREEFNSIMRKDHFAAYIFTKPQSKEVKEKSLLEFAYEQIEGILATSHLTKDGLMNPLSAKLKVEIWKHLDERVHGGIIKQTRIQSDARSLNVNLTKDDSKKGQTVEINETNEETTYAQIELERAEQLTEKLRELREQTRDLESISTTSTVVTYNEQ